MLLGKDGSDTVREPRFQVDSFREKNEEEEDGRKVAS